MDRKITTLLVLSITLCVSAIDVKTYYASLEGKSGDALVSAIMSVSQNGKKVLSYNDVWANRSGADYTASGKIWDMYSDCTFGANDHCSGTSFADCDCYNREHSLPKSWWGGSTDEPMYTDLHHLIPTDGNANSQRSAWPFDNVKNQSWTNGVSKLGTGQHLSGTVFEVADKYKGDIARIYFYMLCCYNNKNFCQGGKGSLYFSYSGGKAAFTSNAARILVQWADSDPVSDKEVTRNNKVQLKQNNRNAFVDLPDLYQYIWGNKKGQVYHLPTALDDIEEEYSYTVEVEGMTLTINTTNNNILAVYNMLGQVIFMQPVHAQQTQIEVPQNGIYLICVGNQAKKVQVAY